MNNTTGSIQFAGDTVAGPEVYRHLDLDVWRLDLEGAVRDARERLPAVLARALEGKALQARIELERLKCNEVAP